MWRSETFSTVQGLLDTAASGLPNAPSAFAEGSVNGCGSRPDVGLRTNDAGNIRTGVPCSGSAAVRSRVTAADSLGGPIWTGHSRSPPPLLRRRPPGWLGAPYGARASLPCWGHASRVPSRGWRGVAPPPFDPPDARAPAEFAGGGLAPRPSCRCVLSRAPHEGHMAAGSCWGRLRGRGLGEATRDLVGQINGELAEDTRAKSALRTALQAHRGKLGNVDPKALAA